MQFTPKPYPAAAALCLALALISLPAQSQTLLGTQGGLEGTFTVDNTTIATAGAANTWQKANATQTIALETSVVRSGSNSLRILNTSTTGRRVYTPLLDTVADGNRLVIQYYRRRPVGTGQENQHGIAFPTEQLNGSYTAASTADTWEKVTYAPTAAGTLTAAGNKWGVVFHRLASGGDNTLPEYIDDLCVYVGPATNIADTVAPDAPTVPAVSNASPTSLAVSWTAPGTGTDNGGYLVVCGSSDPTTAPNVNGIYALSNTITTGQTVVYVGTNTGFTHSNLLTGTNYFYRIYTWDKAFNYSAALSTNGAPAAPAPPVITSQPTSRTNNAGTTATFTVSATGASSYRWFKGVTAYTDGGNVSGATSGTLTLSNVFGADAATNINVVLSNTTGFTTSSVVRLTVIDPLISLQPTNQSVVTGSNATFTVGVTGSAPLAYQWQHAGTNLPGATNAALTLTNIGTAQGGNYQAIVTNAYGSNASAVVTLNINQNSFSLLTYNVKGNFSTTWATNSVQVAAIGREVMYLNPDIITFNEIPLDSTFEMTNFITAFLPGYYMVTNSSSDGFIRSVICSRYPITRSQSYFGTVANGSSLTNYGYNGNYTRDLFEAEISVPNFTQPLHVFTTHLKSGQTTDDTAKRAAESGVVSNYFATGFLTTNSSHPYLITGDWNEDVNRPPSGTPKVLANFTNATVGFRLTTPVNLIDGNDMTHSIQSPTGLAKRYDYILPCGLLFSNIVSSQVFRTDLLPSLPPPLLSTDSSNASDHLPVLMVFNNPYAPSVPTIFTQPVSQTNNLGTTAIFTVSANGTSPLTFQWQRSNTNLTDGGNISGATSNTLTLTTVTTNDVSSYTVIISNSLGTVTSAVATLTIAVPPSIVTQPTSRTNNAGETAVFTVVADGSAPLAYQWRKNSSNISGATSATLSLANVGASDATNYSVVITNLAGAVTSSVVSLTVNLPPNITAQPASLTASQGYPFTLSVTATSTTPLTYQWQFNGGAIAGATNAVFTDTSTALTDAGAYGVIVGNSVGNTTSSVATVTVATATNTLYGTNLIVLRAGDGAQTLSGAGNSTFLDQFTPAGTRVGTLFIPDTNANALVIGPNSTSEGWLSRSADGRFLAFGGYNTNRGAVASLSGATSATVPRGVGLVNAGGQFALGARTLSTFSGGNIRSGATDGTNNFWAGGSANGIQYLGSNAAPGTVQTSASSNTRVLNVFNGNLYFSTGAGQRGIYGFNGLPTGSATTNFFIATGATSSPYDFAFNGAGNLAYVADDSAITAGGGIQKWTNSAGTWTLVYVLTNCGPVRGLAVDFSGANNVLYATTIETTANRLVTVTDSTGDGTATATTLATAGANTTFRGLEFALTGPTGFTNKITSFTLLNASQFQLQFQGVPTYQYVVQFTTNLPGGWTDLSTNVADASGRWFTTNDYVTNRVKFYRSVFR